MKLSSARDRGVGIPSEQWFVICEVGITDIARGRTVKTRLSVSYANHEVGTLTSMCVVFWVYESMSHAV